ncbi:MAG: metal ABC transporter permease [Terrimicrobiaceae bacterium]
MNMLIPPLDWQRVFVQPWTEDFETSFWIVLTGFLAAAACGLVGNFLLLRRVAMVGDAISHSVLFGLVAAFLVAREISTVPMFFAAVATGILTVGLVEFIHRNSRIKADAALCIVFTTLFAAAIVMLGVAEVGGPVHIDPECVLFGEIAFVPLEPPLVWNGIPIGPPSTLRIAGVLVVLVAVGAVFYKELLVTSFDSGLARSLGMRTGFWNYGLMAAVSVVVVSVFEAVGSILPVAMLIVPGMFAAQLSDRMATRFLLTVIHAAAGALIGYHLSVWLDCSPAGAMVVAGSALFAAAWASSVMIRRAKQTRGAKVDSFAIGRGVA